MKMILYLFILLFFSIILFYISASIFNTANPLTDFLLSVLVVHLIMCKIDTFKDEEDEE